MWKRRRWVSTESTKGTNPTQNTYMSSCIRKNFVVNWFLLKFPTGKRRIYISKHLLLTSHIVYDRYIVTRQRNFAHEIPYHLMYLCGRDFTRPLVQMKAKWVPSLSEGKHWHPCARLNRTTASLDALRFEASAHHQAGSCTLKKGVGCCLGGVSKRDVSEWPPLSNHRHKMM